MRGVDSAHSLPGVDDVKAAAAAIDGAVVRTPTAHSDTLSSISGADVWVKFENFQYTASFKERGALNRLLALGSDECARGVVAMSAGNHAQAVAHHATRLSIPSTIVMPATTPANKISRTEDAGASVVVAGETLEAAAAIAHEIEVDSGLTFIAPYDDPLVVAGQGTCVLEMIEDGPDFDTLVVPVGGGGLFAGGCLAARDVSPATQLIGVQSELYPSMLQATGRNPSSPPDEWGPTIAEGIAVKTPGELTTQIISRHADDVVTVPESLIEEAIVRLLEIEKVVAEGAGAAGLAAVLHDRDRFAGRTVGIILSGANIDLRLLSSVIMRGLARTGRLYRFVIDVPDTPGALGALTATVGDAGGNIVDLWHHREFGVHSARVTEIELLVETRDQVNAQYLRDRLADAGYVVDDAPRRMENRPSDGPARPMTPHTDNLMEER